MDAIAKTTAVTEFVARWKGNTGSERANFQSFMRELCELLQLPLPDPGKAENEHNAYVFERFIAPQRPDSTTEKRYIDLYRRDCFVLEGKQTGKVLGYIAEQSQGQAMLETEGLTVDPHQFLGMEINPRAAAIAELVLWIGYLQWHYKLNDRLDLPEPIRVLREALSERPHTTESMAELFKRKPRKSVEEGLQSLVATGIAQYEESSDTWYAAS